jgi:membrane protease YdiL (CAAX protease family)
LAAAVPIAVVHYRGLAVRARTGAQYPSAGWQLRHAWAAFFAFGSASLLSLYTAGALDVTSDGGLLGLDATPAQLARTTLVEGFLAIIILMPLAVRARSRDSKTWTVQWNIAKCVLVGAALGLALRIPLLLAYFARPDAVRMAAPDDAIWQLIIAVRDHYGTLAALWLLSIAAPVIEELVFRGILYRAFTAHIGAGWANALQAALFSAIHLNLKAALFIFVVGLIFGTLTRRSGGLLASIVMHASFNLIAALVFL